MEEQPNVNNLNGVPNFGHGFPEETELPAAPTEETGMEDEVELTTNEE